jgi:blocked-early-in-transport protein 1
MSEMSPRLRAPNALRDRSALLSGFTPPASGRSSPYELPLHASSGHRYADDLEGQNDEHLEGLSAKVKLLKDVCCLVRSDLVYAWHSLHRPFVKLSIGIGNEVRESTIQLSQMVRVLPQVPSWLAV